MSSDLEDELVSKLQSARILGPGDAKQTVEVLLSPKDADKAEAMRRIEHQVVTLNLQYT